MRFTRLLLACVLSLALACPSVLAATAFTGKPHRHFNYAKIVELPSGLLSFRAQVAHYPLSYIALMKKDCQACSWHREELRRTTLFGRIFLPVPTPPSGRWYWRYRTPETADYAVTYSATWYTYRH